MTVRKDMILRGCRGGRNTYAGKLGMYPEKVTCELGVEMSLGIGCAEEGTLERRNSTG